MKSTHFVLFTLRIVLRRTLTASDTHKGQEECKYEQHFRWLLFYRLNHHFRKFVQIIPYHEEFYQSLFIYRFFRLTRDNLTSEKATKVTQIKRAHIGTGTKLSVGLAVLQCKVGSKGRIESTIAVANVQTGANDRCDRNAIICVGIKLTTDIESRSHRSIANLNISSDCRGQLLGLWVEIETNIGSDTNTIVASKNIISSKSCHTKTSQPGKLSARVVEINSWCSGKESLANLLGACKGSKIREMELGRMNKMFQKVWEIEGRKKGNFLKAWEIDGKNPGKLKGECL